MIAALLFLLTPVFAQVASSPSFEDRLQEYVAIYEQPQATTQTRRRALSPLRLELFASPFDAQYERRLRLIDSLHDTHPEAIRDLAYALQMRWESLYADQARSAATADRSRSAIEAETTGAMGGLIILVASLPQTRAGLSLYFMMARGAAPVLGLTAGHFAHPSSSVRIPASPAQVMGLGLPVDIDLESFARARRGQEFSRRLTALTTAISVASTARQLGTFLQILRAAQVASAPARLHPGVLLLSLACTQIPAGLDHLDTVQYERSYRRSAATVARAMRRPETFDAVANAMRFSRDARQLSFWRNRNVLAAVERAADEGVFVGNGFNDEQLRQAMQGRGNANLRSVFEELGNRLGEHLEELAEIDTTDDRAVTVLSLLAVGGSVDDLQPNQALVDMARAHQRSFARWVAAREARDGATLGADERARAFQQYAAGALTALDDRLVEAMQREVAPLHPYTVLRQASSYLRSFGNDLLNGEADQIDSQLRVTQLLLQSISGGQL